MTLQHKAIITLYAIAFSLLTSNALLNSIDLNSKLAKQRVSPVTLGFSVLSAQSAHRPGEYTIFGFLPYWKLNETNFIQTDKLTDIAYFALSVEKNGEIKKISEEGTIDPGYNNWKNNPELEKLIQKAQNNGVDVSLTVISHDDEITDKFLSCRECWETLTNELISELKQKDIKNVNFDFEYTVYTDSLTADKYTEFIKFSHRKLDEEFENSFVTVSAFADSFVKPRITDVESLATAVDAIFIMAYDFHQPNSDNAGPVSPIQGAGTITSYDIETMLKDYLRNVPPSKLILGVPYYGYNWVVTSTEPYAERVPGDDYIGYSISQTYAGVIETILSINPHIQWDGIAQVPYFSYISPETGSTRMVYYENTESLKIKYKIIKQNKLGGVGIWALGYDGGYQELWNLLETEFFDTNTGLEAPLPNPPQPPDKNLTNEKI